MNKKELIIKAAEANRELAFAAERFNSSTSFIWSIGINNVKISSTSNSDNPGW